MEIGNVCYARSNAVQKRPHVAAFQHRGAEESSICSACGCVFALAIPEDERVLKEIQKDAGKDSVQIPVQGVAAGAQAPTEKSLAEQLAEKKAEG